MYPRSDGRWYVKNSDGVVSVVSNFTEAQINTKIGNDLDTYTGTAPVTNIVTLSQIEFDGIVTKNPNILYIPL
jgi:hypothetical protein